MKSWLQSFTLRVLNVGSSRWLCSFRFNFKLYFKIEESSFIGMISLGSVLSQFSMYRFNRKLTNTSKKHAIVYPLNAMIWKQAFLQC